MGIQGLLPLLKSIMVPIHIKELEGSCVAVDTYSWLHKGALCCSTELCKGIPTSRHIDYCMHRVNLLRHYGVKPVMVFDGGLLPMKGDQENKRARSRKENLARAIEHEADGNSSAAFECYQKAVDISPAIAYELIQVLKRENVCYVVAPYEADAQLTFLAITKQIEAVITEDSDLIPFGCPRIIFKMDKFGQGVQFNNSLLQHNTDISFMGFSKQMILEMCIMSGCDYLQSLPGMGLKKAHTLIKKFKSYDKAIKHLRHSSVSIPPMYEESFKKAIRTFQYQRVYDPTIEDIVHLTDIPDNMNDDLDFLGPLMPQPVAKGVATGDLDPFTKFPFQVVAARPEKKYKVNSFKPETERKKLQLPPQRNLVTNYLKVGTDNSKHSVGDSAEKYPSVLHSSHVMLPCRNKKMLIDQECEVPVSEVGTKVCRGSQIIIVRSSYFQSKGVGLNSCEHVDRMVCDTDDIANSKYKNEVLQGIKDVATNEGEQGMLSVKVDKAVVAIDKGVKGMTDCKDASLTDKWEDTTASAFTEFSFNSALPKLKAASSSSIKTIENGKAVTRSSYFQSTKIACGDLKDKMEMTFPIKRKQLAAEDSPVSSSLLKRKVYSEEENQAAPSYLRENAKWRKPSTSDLQESDYTFMNKPLTEANHYEKKFGCNISHLDNYKGISGKSFQSLTSTFKFNSSGSRASGLRAPLKDVQNISKNSPAAPVADISKFSYVPSTVKVVWKPCTRRG